MRFKSFRIAAVAAALAAQATAFMAPASARPLTPAEQRYARWHGALPKCDDPSVTGFIQTRFGEREGYYWDSGLAINDFQRVREIGFRSTGVDYIPRRYCAATALLSDHSAREVYYNIGEDLGFTGADALGGLLTSLTLGTMTSRVGASFGINWGVDWCVLGLDRNVAYGLNCRAARP
jgi:hypothetical protein